MRWRNRDWKKYKEQERRRDRVLEERKKERKKERMNENEWRDENGREIDKKQE